MKRTFILMCLFSALLLTNCKKEETGPDFPTAGGGNTPAMESYLEYDGKKYELPNVMVKKSEGYNSRYFTLALVSSSVKYDSFLRSITGNGNGIQFYIHTPDSDQTLPPRSYPMIVDNTINHYEIYSVQLFFNKNFFMLDEGIDVPEGTLTISQKNDKMQFDFTGKDESGKSVKCKVTGKPFYYTF